MLTRIFLSACIAVTACGGALAATDGDPDRPLVTGAVPDSKAANTDSIWMDLGSPVRSAKGARKATQLDVNRLKRLRTRPSVKCARIEYVYQCLSSQDMHLTHARCRAGSTEASCCKGVRDHVNAKICGPIWNRFKKAGKTYLPGIWLCKCVEEIRTRRLKPGEASRAIRPEASGRLRPQHVRPRK